MPGFNQTGPPGAGPITGRGRGLHATDKIPNRGPVSTNTGMGRGLRFGRGRGMGRGLRRGFDPVNSGGFQANQGMVPQSDPKNLQTDIDRFQTQIESLQRSLDAINERVPELEKSK